LIHLSGILADICQKQERRFLRHLVVGVWVRTWGVSIDNSIVSSPAITRMVSSAKEFGKVQLLFVLGSLPSVQQNRIKEHARKNGFIIVDKPSK
jgi:hypothetical protein